LIVCLFVVISLWQEKMFFDVQQKLDKMKQINFFIPPPCTEKTRLIFSGETNKPRKETKENRQIINKKQFLTFSLPKKQTNKREKIKRRLK
jgi:hypothetical protein